MVDLAIHYDGQPVSIKNISERQGISEYYLEQLFSQLRKANLIRSIRGAQGGYILSKDPKYISIDDIMKVLEGPVEISECIDDIDGNSCNNVGCCATRLLWSRIRDSIDNVMESTTLQNIVDDYNSMNKKKIVKKE